MKYVSKSYIYNTDNSQWKSSKIYLLSQAGIVQTLVLLRYMYLAKCTCLMRVVLLSSLL